ncbi:hypothetical protein Q7C36_005423 [Tachysurus vachellii]|uniref:Uncharacterized protein n=1 Tax=Tachysurus vachellii TaxID=175792 RepID=A0AA88T811_TACVA|nr:hypothetical protein Q7C36_005423 [Tachysurus vachellii]
MRRIESPELSDCHLQLASLSFIQQHQVIKFALGQCGTLETLAHTYDRWTEIAGAAAGSEPGIIRACDGYECMLRLAAAQSSLSAVPEGKRSHEQLIGDVTSQFTRLEMASLKQEHGRRERLKHAALPNLLFMMA